MLTEKQKKWISHLDSNNKIHIIPYNPETKKIFNIIKNDLIKVLGKTTISHRGSTKLKISGQGEIDLYIPVTNKKFKLYLYKLIKYIGKPRSLYDLERARFIKYINNIKIEIFLINKNCEGWKNCIKFEKYLKENSKALNEYIKVKNKVNGLSTRRYYAAKTEFINKILDLTIK